MNVRGKRFASIKRKFEENEPITARERQLLLYHMNLVLEGYDPRDDLGIKHKAGTPPRFRKFHYWMTVHYLLVLDLYKQDGSRSPEKGAALLAAKTCSVIRRVAKLHGS
jgi:hypothetical protein